MSTSLLSIEWLKIKSYKVFQIFSIAYVVLVSISLYSFYKMSGKVHVNGQEIDLLSRSLGFPSIYHFAGFINSFLVFFLCFIVINLTCNEFTFRTGRQNIIDGYSRKQFYTAQWLKVLMFSFAATILYFLMCIFSSLLSGNGLYGILSDVEYIFFFFVYCVNYLGLATLISILVKKSTVAIFIFLSYAVIIESILVGLLNYKNLSIRYYLPLESVDNLFPFPGSSLLEASGLISPSANPFYLVSAALLWIGVYYFVGWKKISTADL